MGSISRSTQHSKTIGSLGLGMCVFVYIHIHLCAHMCKCVVILAFMVTTMEGFNYNIDR